MRRSGLTILAACASLWLVAPAAADAASVIGSDLGGTAIASNCASPSGCVIVQDTIGGSFVEAPAGGGVITQWRTRGAEGTMELRVYRQRSDATFTSGEIHAAFVDNSAQQDGNAGSQSFATRIPVEGGDYIALALAEGSAYGQRQGPPAGTRAFRFFDTGAAEIDSTSGESIELYLQARVEPDADGDGYGDETQDSCVGDCGGGGGGPSSSPATPHSPAAVVDPYAALRAKGPKVSISRSVTASRKGTVPVVVTNPYGFGLKGSLTLKVGKKKAGKRKKFSLAAGAKKVVKVKLTRRFRRVLVRKRKLKATALAKMKAPVGKARTTRKKLTIKSARKRKKRRRRHSGAKWKDGNYRGTWTSTLSSAPGSGGLTFTVSGGRVTSFTAPHLDVYCSGSFAGTAKQDFKGGNSSAPISSDGSFQTTVKGKNEVGESLTYKGKLASDGRATGRLNYSDNDFYYSPITGGYNSTTCFGAATWTANSG